MVRLVNDHLNNGIRTLSPKIFNWVFTKYFSVTFTILMSEIIRRNVTVYIRWEILFPVRFVSGYETVTKWKYEPIDMIIR